MMSEVGDTIGHLTILGEATRSGRKAWRCRCVCGNEHIVRQSNLGTTQSCGCMQRTLRSAVNTKHGHSSRGRRSPEMISYAAMKSRCYNKKNNRYEQYGAKGVVVCERWRLSFEVFLEDMGPRPPGTSIDRYPISDGNYEPNNCRWATPKQQVENRKPLSKGNVAKTHCPAGHPYVGKNLRIMKRGGRQCRECDLIRTREKRKHAKPT